MKRGSENEVARARASQLAPPVADQIPLNRQEDHQSTLFVVSIILRPKVPTIDMILIISILLNWFVCRFAFLAISIYSAIL